MTSEPLSASAAAVGRTYTNSKGVKVTITGLNAAGDKVIVRTEAGRTVDLDLTYPLYAIAEEAPAGAVTVASLVGRPRDAITPHLPALTDAELEQLGNLDTRMWLGHAIMEEIDRRGKAASEAPAAPVVEAAPTPTAPPLSAPLPFPARTPPPWEATADQVPVDAAPKAAVVEGMRAALADGIVVDDPIENPPAAHAAVHPDDTAAPAKAKRPRKPKAEAPAPVDEAALQDARARAKALGAEAFGKGEDRPLVPLSADLQPAWAEGYQEARAAFEAGEEERIAAATDDDVFGWLDEALGHVSNGSGSTERVQELVDDALEAREALRPFLRKVLDEIEGGDRTQTAWNSVEVNLRAALRQLSDAAEEEAPADQVRDEAAAPDLAPTVADFPEAHAAGTVAAKAGAPNEPPAYDSPVARAAWTAGWLAWRGPASEVEPAECPACERGASAYSAGIAHTCERFAHLGTPPAAPVFLMTVDEFAAGYLREHGAPELADDAETLDTIRGLTANVREQMSALAGCYNGTVIAAALAWERANENRESLVRKLEERAGRIADGSARPRKASTRPAAPAPAPVPTSDAEIIARTAAADPASVREVPPTETFAPLPAGDADPDRHFPGAYPYSQACGGVAAGRGDPAIPPAYREEAARSAWLKGWHEWHAANDQERVKERTHAIAFPPAPTVDQVPTPPPASHGPTLSADGRKRAAAIRARLEALREAVPALIAAEEALAALRDLGVTVDLGVHLSAPTPTAAC